MSADTNYIRIAQAIEYLNQNFKTQPSLAEIAQHIHLSEAHFHRLFTEWAGVSPKKFLQYISLQHAKCILKSNKQNSLLDATYQTGLSSPSRLHDLFIQIEGMTPAEYKHGGKSLSINYSFIDTLFGSMLIASTNKGICAMAFIDNTEAALDELKAQFPNAQYRQHFDPLQQQASKILQSDAQQFAKIKLHLKASKFQLKVWQSLLSIPMGALTSYAAIAQQIGQDKATRAVGSAIGRNPVALIIPCHRVIQSTGHFAAYKWGTTRKTAIIGWEGAKTDTSEAIIESL